MGQKWRRKPHSHKKKVTSRNGIRDETSKMISWTFRERPSLSQYLSAYRDGVIQVYRRLPLTMDTTYPRRIGGVDFPALTEEVLQRPFLELPKSLTSKQRRIIHEACVEGMEHGPPLSPPTPSISWNSSTLAVEFPGFLLMLSLTYFPPSFLSTYNTSQFVSCHGGETIIGIAGRALLGNIGLYGWIRLATGMDSRT